MLTNNEKRAREIKRAIFATNSTIDSIERLKNSFSPVYGGSLVEDFRTTIYQVGDPSQLRYTLERAEKVEEYFEGVKVAAEKVLADIRDAKNKAVLSISYRVVDVLEKENEK